MIDFRQIVSRLCGPVGSAVLHVLIVLLLIRFMVFRTPREEPAVPVQLSGECSLELDRPAEPLEPLPEMTDESELELAEELDVDFSELPEVQQVEAVKVDFVMPSAAAPSVTVPVNTMFAGRTVEAREKLLKKYAGKYAEDVDKAVLRALNYLKTVQSPDGSWGPEGESMQIRQERCRLTGLALLAFLSHGETPQSADYGRTVGRAIEYLRGGQDERGRFCPFSGSTRATSSDDIAVYGHAIATYALCEAYALTRAPVLRKELYPALRIIIEGQQEGGGWDHRYQKAKWSDLSVAGWQIQALNAAAVCGLRVPGLQTALQKAKAAVAAHHKSEGTFYYRLGNKTAQTYDYMTGTAVLCLQLLGERKSALVSDGLKYLENVEVTDWQAGWEKTGASRSFNMAYEWYYNTQAIFQAGGSKWKSWNRQFAPMLLGAQAPDGSWKPPAEAKVKVSNDILNVTAYSALALQVYYRILPTFARTDALEAPQEFPEKIKVRVVWPAVTR